MNAISKNKVKKKLKEILKDKDLKLIDYSDKTEWSRIREKGIGGSDIGAILGVNKYATAVDVFLNKTNQNMKKEENKFMKWGIKLESVLRDECSERHPEFEVYEVPFTIKKDFYIANVDGLIIDKETGKAKILEIKTTSFFNESEWRNGEIPQSYYCQVQHYLYVTGLSEAVIIVLMGGSEYKEYIVKRNDEDIKYILDVTKAFWNDNVLKNKIPSPDGSDAYSQYQNEKMKKIEMLKNSIEIQEENLIKKRMDNTELIKQLELENKKIDQQITDMLIDNDTLNAYSKNYEIKMVVQNRMKINSNFKKENLELITAYEEAKEKYKENYQTRFLKYAQI